MKKRLLAGILGAMMLFGLTACGKEEPKRSGQIEIDSDKLVKTLCDYEAIELQLSEEYEVTDAMLQEGLTTMLQNFGLESYTLTNRTEIVKGDYVKVDYVGYHNGEAFDRGSATGVILFVSDNNGYIPGFTDGLVGAKVGESVSSDVTFPDVYNNNPDLAGELTTFEFVIHGIYDPITPDMLSDEVIAQTFSTTIGVSTVQGLMDYIAKVLQNTLDSNKYSETVSEAGKYMLENCEVEVPEEYLEARLREFKDSFKESYCKEDESLEDYLMDNYETSLEDAEKEWTAYLEEQIKIELIFEQVAKKAGIELDEEEYQLYINGFMETENGGFEDEEALYDYYGAGNQEEGEEYLRRLFVVNKAITYVAENAVIVETEE